MKEHNDRVKNGVLFGCHCDLNPDEVADQCVIDLGNTNDCVHATDECANKWNCSFWKPVTQG